MQAPGLWSLLQVQRDEAGAVSVCERALCERASLSAAGQGRVEHVVTCLLCPAMKKPSFGRHVMKRENSDPVLLAEMTENTRLGRIVRSLKAMDVKATQPETVPGGLQRLGNMHGFLKRYLV